MGSNVLEYDAAGTAAMNAVTALLNGGYIEIYTGSQPALDGALTGTLLVTLSFAATAFLNAFASAGVITAIANPVTAGTAVATGTAGYFVLLQSDGVSIVLTGLVGNSGSDLNLTNTSITLGQAIPLAAFSITQAQ